MGDLIDLIESIRPDETTGGAIKVPQALLSPRELQVITMMTAGSTLPEISQDLRLTISTIKSHIKHARKKYQLMGRDAGTAIRLIRCAIEDGVVPPIVPREVK